MKKTILCFLCMFSLLLSSCAKSSGEKIETTLWEGKETTQLVAGSTAYVEDYEEHGEQVAAKYFDIRNQGNPDPEGFENAVLYQNGTDITLQLTSETYSLSNSDEKWGVHILNVSEDLDVRQWEYFLNLEKYEEETWVRQGVLTYARLYTEFLALYLAAKNDWGPYPEYGYPMLPEMWKDALTVLSPLTIDPTTIFPEPTPGKYRFVFYLSVFDGEEIEYRKYYIPFEVVE